jgi:UDP-N-acetylglucosamine transferase subunit ALG13
MGKLKEQIIIANEQNDNYQEQLDNHFVQIDLIYQIINQQTELLKSIALLLKAKENDK